ncbi:hypothetical protein PHYSODRAFT_518474 [Phytophthora sojae]|uniref:Uncharacterized protein n=1 Tax=Phytophthora sojae (strain P6497) TaxID=1094619 RepID=G5A0M0_PHYSP|nr:hypothetical protein PHYSODRAFT_518474 [Phytophthora sojae]EGZ10556.1 hypothetical protein PHYSODRAFT_518474 [Phytophthora sojae]|eukprot:XP_009533301.1 hypothetical protein PHYSODRAFT_518474 [Phytophthora sojae]
MSYHLGLHRIVLFYLPNRDYHHSLSDLSSSQLWSSVDNVLLYSLLELISWIIVVVVLKRKLGLSPLRQLAFVLETQKEDIQAKLILVFVYVTQLTLAHPGTHTNRTAPP